PRHSSGPESHSLHATLPAMTAWDLERHTAQRFCRRGPRESPTRCTPVPRLSGPSPTQRFPRSAAPVALHCGCRRNADASRADPRRICPLRRARHMCRLASRPRSRRCRNLRWRRADAPHRPPRRPPEGSGRAVQVFVGSKSWSAHLSQGVDPLDTDTDTKRTTVLFDSAVGAPVTAWVTPSRKVAGPIRPVTPGPLHVDIATLYDAVHQQITVEGGRLPALDRGSAKEALRPRVSTRIRGSPRGPSGSASVRSGTP